MSCSYASGLMCNVTGDRCMFMSPNSKACAEMYGEGPDAERDTCETCTFFYTENGGRRCHRGLLDPNANDLTTTTNIIDEDMICCGAHTTEEKEYVAELSAELAKMNSDIADYYEHGRNPYMMEAMIQDRDNKQDELNEVLTDLKGF